MYAHTELKSLIGSYLLLKYHKRKESIGRPKLLSPFSTLFIDLRSDDKKFFNYFHMSMKTFDELLAIIEPKITLSSIYREPIPPVQRLALTLRYLISGCSVTSFHFTYKLGVSTASLIITGVCSTIWELLNEKCLPQPSTEEWKAIAEGFDNKAKFPNCVGAIDIRRIQLNNPKKKDESSIDLLTICDSNYCFIHVNVDYMTKRNARCTKTGRVLLDNSVLSKLVSNDLPLPGARILTGSIMKQAPHIFVSSELHILSKRILTPYPPDKNSHEYKVFNYRLKRVMRYANTTLAILTNKFQIFQRPMTVYMKKAKIATKACCVLHNFILSREGYRDEDTTLVRGPTNIQNGKYLPYDALRNLFANYFVSVAGKLEWQDQFIRSDSDEE